MVQGQRSKTAQAESALFSKLFLLNGGYGRFFGYWNGILGNMLLALREHDG